VIRLLLVDDHLAFRQPLAFMLGRESDISVIGQAGGLAEARRLLPEADIALIDLNLSDGDGVALIKELKVVNPGGRALVLTATGARSHIAEAVEAGAVGVLHKSCSLDEVVAAIRRLEAGDHLLSPAETIELLRLVGQQRERDRAAQASTARLTRREHEVLQALAEGLHDREIGERLHVSTETVRTHMVNLLHKLGVDSRLQALVFAVRHGVVQIN
jgi:DNA-binding NarL/FixJ family response regulator